jgi:hypothetical protein
MWPFGPFDGLWKVPVCILWTSVIGWGADFFKSRDGGLAPSVVALRGVG